MVNEKLTKEQEEIIKLCEEIVRKWKNKEITFKEANIQLVDLGKASLKKI